ncbi:MAG: type secretion system protein GspD [Verrucomicrobiaceae bacterium]|nr:type secretion system protein GspD [Verrucomicrobiaceae bacterium]
MNSLLRDFRRLLFVGVALLCVSAPRTWAEQTWTINFKDTELEEVVRFVAQATGKTIIVDSKAKGRVQVISSQPLNQEQLYDLFLSILDVNGFAAVDSGGVLRIIPSRDARSSAAPVVSGNKQRENSEIVTEVIQLKNISAATLIPVLRPLAPQQAHMAAYAPSNAIIISDAASNIASIRAVIDRIDRAAVGETEVIRLEHASAEEVVRMLDQLDKGDPTKAQGEVAGKTVVMVADKRTNSILISGDSMQRQRARVLVSHLDGPLAQSGNVKVIYLQYAKAKDLSTVLNKVMQNVAQMQPGQTTQASSGKGKATIEADEGTNSLIVTADADVMSSLQAVIERLDIRRAQVLVEAIIVEMSSSKERDLGIQWMFSNSAGAYGSSSMADGLLANTAAAAFGVLPTTDTTTSATAVDPRLALGSALSTNKGQVFGIGRVGNNFSFNAVLNALQQNTDANILSTPSLLTLDNEEASIVVGQEVPFKTGSYTSTGNATAVSSPFETIQRQNVGLTLKVTPHINEGDSLVLEISQEVSSLSGAASTVNASDVITNERKIESKVLADNGQVIVLGGLIKEDVQETAQKVPLLGDIPVIGRLFRSNASTKTKTNLMVFLRPVIVRDGRVLTGATGDKYRFIRNEQLEVRERGSDFLSRKELPLLPEWEEQLKKIEELQDLKQRNDILNLEQQRRANQAPGAAPANGDAAPGAGAQ